MHNFSIKKIYFNKRFSILIFISFLSIIFYYSNNDETQKKNEHVYLGAFDSNAFVLDSALPVKISIPKINLQTDFEEPLDLNNNSEVEVPKNFSKVGWYKHSPTPGALGPAVILGHVDSYGGPAVFFYLGQLTTGDDIYIEREDGKTAHFKVEFLERYEQKKFPTEQVYGNIDYAGLRLVTCSGIYLKGVQRYTHNLVVYARLVE